MLTVLMVAACVAVAPSGMQDEAAPDSMMGGTLRIALPADITSLDLHKTSRGDDALVVGQWFNATLITQNSDGEFIGYLAESWEFSEDGLTWTFHLRDDVTFHNGDALTAHDFVWTYERALDPDLASPGTGKRLNGMTFEATDDYTLVFNFPTPTISLLQFVTWGYMAPMSQRAVEEGGAEYEPNPVGTGPYRVVDVRPGEGLTLERWDDYNWGPAFFEGANSGPYYFDAIEFSILPEEATRVAALEAGDIDFVNGVSNPLDVPILEAAGVGGSAGAVRTGTAGLHAEPRPALRRCTRAPGLQLRGEPRGDHPDRHRRRRPDQPRPDKPGHGGATTPRPRRNAAITSTWTAPRS